MNPDSGVRRKFSCQNSCHYYSAPDLEGPRTPTMFMCLAICATCACHLVMLSEKSLFETLLIYRSAQRQYFTRRMFDIVTKQLLTWPCVYSCRDEKQSTSLPHRSAGCKWMASLGPRTKGWKYTSLFWVHRKGCCDQMEIVFFFFDFI